MRTHITRTEATRPSGRGWVTDGFGRPGSGGFGPAVYVRVLSRCLGSGRPVRLRHADPRLRAALRRPDSAHRTPDRTAVRSRERIAYPLLQPVGKPRPNPAAAGSLRSRAGRRFEIAGQIVFGVAPPDRPKIPCAPIDDRYNV